MPRKCTVCTNKKRSEIDKALIEHAPAAVEAEMVAEASATALAAPPERTPEEQSLVETFLARHKNQPPQAKLTDTKLRTLEADARDIPLWFAKMAETLAIQDPDLQSVLLGQAAGIFWKCDAQTALNATLAFVHDVRPLDATEGLLALQMMATHNAAMEMLRRALLEEQPHRQLARRPTQQRPGDAYLDGGQHR